MLTVALALLLAAPPPALRPVLKPQADMPQALRAVIRLEPFLSRPSAFRDPATEAEIHTTIDILANVQHAFMRPIGSPGVDTIYARQVQRARTEFESGDKDAARMRLRGVTSLCLACHLRAPTPQATTDLRLAGQHLRLAPLERAQFYALTRQTDRALDLWNKALIQTPADESEAYDQADALRLAVSVAVRATDSPEAVIKLLEPQVNRAALPAVARAEARGWLEEARAWQMEHFRAASASPFQLYQRARALIATTNAEAFPTTLSQRYVTLLRANAYLQRALDQAPTSSFRPEALYLLGVTAASVDDPLLWQLEWLYLEACIRENPHSLIAQACAQRLTERTVRSYGNAATVPAHVDGALGELNALAK